ncbi:MAG: hypothetical protein O9327_05840 [Polaromonas sp.]|nr:hypothetical protein [Polaromonas sp.]
MNPAQEPGSPAAPASTALITARLLSVFAFNDFDIEGHESIKRVTIGHRMAKNDVFNVYHRSGAKVGAPWRGTLRASLLAALGSDSLSIAVGPEGATHVDPKGYFWAKRMDSTTGEVCWQRFCPMYGWTPNVHLRWIETLVEIPPAALTPSALLRWAGPDNLALVDAVKRGAK